MFKFHIFNPFFEFILAFFPCLHDSGGVGKDFGGFFGYLVYNFSLLLNLFIDHLGFWQKLFSFFHTILCCPFSNISLCRTSWLFCCWPSVVFWLDRILRRTFHQVFLKVVFLHWANIVECISIIDLLQLYDGRILLAPITFGFAIYEDLIVVSDLLWAWTSIFFKGFAQCCHGVVSTTVFILLCWLRLVLAWTLNSFFVERLALIISILQKICAVSLLTNLSEKSPFVFLFFQISCFQ